MPQVVECIPRRWRNKRGLKASSCNVDRMQATRSKLHYCIEHWWVTTNKAVPQTLDKTTTFLFFFFLDYTTRGIRYTSTPLGYSTLYSHNDHFGFIMLHELMSKLQRHYCLYSCWQRTEDMLHLTWLGILEGECKIGSKKRDTCNFLDQFGLHFRVHASCTDLWV